MQKFTPTQRAKRLLKPAAKTSQSDHPLARRAVAAWEAHQYDRALEMFASAHHLAPGNVPVMLDYARALGLRYQKERALELFAKAAKLRPNDPFVHGRAGEACVAMERFDLALPYFQQAAASPHCGCGVWLEMAKIHERLHQLDAMEKCLVAAQTRGADPMALLKWQALLLKRRGEKDAAESLLRRGLEQPSREPQFRSECWYELAALLDERGAYDEAMTAFIYAKKILEPSATIYRRQSKEVEREHRALIDAIAPESSAPSPQFQRWHDAAPEIPANRQMAVLCGYPRSGTTLLEQVLDTHSSLVSADESSIMGDDVVSVVRTARADAPFAEALDALTPEEIRARRAAYFQFTEAFLAESIGERCLLDKNPALTNALPVICRVFPECRFLIALRDPRDVVMSCFMQSVPINAVSSNWLSLETTVAHYVSLLSGWLRIRPKLCNRWLEVRYEDTVADLEKQARRCLDFLGLPWDESVLRYFERAKQKHVHSPTYRDVTQPVYRRAIGRWRNYEKYLAPHLSALEPFIKAFGYE